MDHHAELTSPLANAGDITVLLEQIATGDNDAAASLWTQVQSELRAMASQLLSRESDAVTLQTTQLINEAWLRMHGANATTSWEHRGHFFGSVARAMGQVLIDRSRRRNAAKRGEGARPMPLSVLEDPPQSGVPLTETACEPLLEAFGALGSESRRASDVVWLRVVAGLTVPQVAAALDVSERTVASDWKYACAWLRSRLSDQDG